MKRMWRLSICLVGSISGIPATRDLNPFSAYSGSKLIPDLPVFRASVTSLKLLPIGETTPRPVITTRRICPSH